jgi:hypothetical protein
MRLGLRDAPGAPSQARMSRATIKIEIERTRAETLLELLERRLEVIQKLEILNGPVASLEIEREKGVIIPLMVALESALKTPPTQ